MTARFSDERAPSVSVLMPVFNADRYLADAIDSVLAQTFGDFEFMILDDGSSDGSLEIIERYAARDSRIRVISRENRGLVESLNELARAAGGQYLARMDADDICFRDRFEKQVAYLDAHPDCVVVGGWAIMVDEDCRPIVPLKPPLDHDGIDSGNLSGRTSFIHPSVLIRRSAFLQAGLYDLRYPHAEDKELWLRMAEIGRLANLPEYCLRYRVHMQSVSSQNQEVQNENCRQASAEAAARRGVANPFHREPFRSDGSPESEHAFALKYGWQAWSWGFRATSRRFALRALRHRPLSLAAWKLLAFGSLKRSPKTLDITL